MRNLPLVCFLLTSLAGIGIFSCKKDEPDPNKDNRLFICKINGVEWKPKVDPCYLCPFNPKLYAGTDGERSFSILAQRDFRDDGNIKQIQSMWIDIVSIQENNEPLRWKARYLTFNNGDCAHFRTDSTYANVLKITRFDGVYRGILKGEFEFRLVNEDDDCRDTLLVTEGRFDFRTDL